MQMYSTWYLYLYLRCKYSYLKLQYFSPCGPLYRIVPCIWDNKPPVWCASETSSTGTISTHADCRRSSDKTAKTSRKLVY